MNAKKANKKSIILSQERLFNMKKFFLFVLALSVCASAADGSVEERVNGLQAQVDRAMSKAGIHFSGEFRSQFLNSSLDGDAVGDGKKNESVEYTSVDIDIVARPNTALSARAMFRLHQDWRNFFSDVQNPITTRWLSIDGSLMQGIFKYNIGDYSRKLTPLTLWAPDVDFLYEPEIFAQNRRLAMSEAFVGGNDRALQGANLAFKAELYPILHEVSADFFGARLAATGTGESGVAGTAKDLKAPDSPTSPDGIPDPDGSYWDALYDKYLVGANLGMQIVKGAGFGVSNISIFDYVNSYHPESTPGGNGAADSTKAKQYAQSTNIFSGRANVDTRVFMPDDFINVGLNFEAAFSSDKDSYFDEKENVLDSTINGMAINAGLSARVALGEENTLKLSVDFMQNDTNFRNEAAQSPTFVQRAIMNNENGLEGLGLLNPFDALYRSVFKYSPSQYFGRARPYTKNAYTNSILSREQATFINGATDAYHGSKYYTYPSIFQTALPGGMATADRSGPVVKFNGSFLDEGVTLGVKAAMLKSISETGGIYDTTFKKDENDVPLDEIEKIDITKAPYKTDFVEMVFGGSVDIAKFAPAVGPSLLISGSFGMYNVKADEFELKNDLISIGLNYNFAPRFSVLVGYQLLTTYNPSRRTWSDTTGGSVKLPVGVERIDYDVQNNYEFGNLSFGLSYKVADGGVLTAKISMLSGKQKPSADSKVTETYTEDMDGNIPEPKIYNYVGKSYTAFQPEVYLTVKF